ncbi:hypothetical protein BOTBODRAFT_46144 [Botryobasidium botryosum FD-172 SS1]|uniref:Endonuclease/exonuclease/phosphatase domain-containing protein n=1 Tax=Botryobasidium botryosum (strain FD-172 SS1) TaxID=930990 RepID=A0A067MK09_BOTB1|nr:hypothetical protein BOTBODRAFT_46144 [Botryobasidium botryosum FD-172 SS1]
MFINKSLLDDVRITPRLDLTGNSPNTMAVDIHNSIRIINHYTLHAQKDSFDYEPLYKLLELSIDSPFVLMGDFNLKHVDWDRHLSSNQTAAVSFRDRITSMGLRIHNDGHPTYYGWRQEYRTAIDLTISNTDPAERAFVDEWSAGNTAAHGSDHAALFVNYHTNAPLLGKKRPLAYSNWRNTDSEAFGKAIRFHLKATDISFGPEGEVQEMYDALEEAVDMAFKTSTPEARQMPHSKPWWNKDLTAFNRDIHSSHICLQNLIEIHGNGSSPVIDQARIWRKACNDFELAEKRARNKHYESVLVDVLPNTIWKKAGRWGMGEEDVVEYILTCQEGLKEWALDFDIEIDTDKYETGWFSTTFLPLNFT